MDSPVVTQGLAALSRAVQADNRNELETALKLYKQGMAHMVRGLTEAEDKEEKFNIRREMNRHLERLKELQETHQTIVKRKKTTEQDRLYNVVQYLSANDLKDIILAKLTQVHLQLDDDPGVGVGIAGLSWFLPPFEFPFSNQPKSSRSTSTTPRSGPVNKGIKAVPKQKTKPVPRVPEDLSFPSNLNQLLEVLWDGKAQIITLDRLDCHFGPFTPLQWAAGLTTSDCVLSCLEAGAKLDKRSRVLLPQASLTLHGYASTLQDVEVAIDYTSDADDDGEWTALMMSVMFGNVATVALLVEAGSDIYAVSRAGRSAVDFAYMRGESDIIDVLEEAQLAYENIYEEEDDAIYSF